MTILDETLTPISHKDLTNPSKILLQIFVNDCDSVISIDFGWNFTFEPVDFKIDLAVQFMFRLKI